MSLCQERHKLNLRHARERFYSDSASRRIRYSKDVRLFALFRVLLSALVALPRLTLLLLLGLLTQTTKVLNTEAILERMVKSKQYTQAQDLKKDVERKKAQEEARFEREKEERYRKVLNQEKKRLEQEMSVLQARHRRELAEFEKDKNESLTQFCRFSWSPSLLSFSHSLSRWPIR